MPLRSYSTRSVFSGRGYDGLVHMTNIRHVAFPHLFPLHHKQGHGKAVDWWAVGVLIYEMLAGYPPFYDDDTMNTYRKILRCSMQFPADMSPTARDLISKLIQVDLSKRIGTLASGVADIKQHPWFRGFDWSAAAGRGLAPPIRPVVRGADDTSNFDDYSHVEPLKTGCELSPAEQALFAGF